MLGWIRNATKSGERLRKWRQPLSRVPVVENRKFVLIGGLHRSGTTILHQLLCDHPLASGLQDTGVPRDEGQHLQSVFPPAHRYGGPGEFAFHLDAHLTENTELINLSNRDKLLREWGAYYDLEKSVWLEKSPPNLIRSRFLRQMLPNTTFVFIVRHPIAVSLATEKWTSNTIIERLLHWLTAHTIMLEDIESADDCLVFRYEDFVDDPGKVLDLICNTAGIDRFVASRKVEDRNRDYLLDWQRQYGPEIETLQAILPVTNPVMEHFGYSLSEPFVQPDVMGNRLNG